MKMLIKFFGVLYILHLTFFVNCQSNEGSQSTNSTASTNEEKGPKTTLFDEFVGYLKNNSISSNDDIVPEVVYKHLAEMFRSQVPEKTKERTVFIRLAKSIAKDIPETMKVHELKKFFNEEDLMKRLHSIYKDVMDEINKYKAEQEDEERKKKEEEQLKKGGEVIPDETVDLGDVSSEEKEDL